MMEVEFLGAFREQPTAPPTTADCSSLTIDNIPVCRSLFDLDKGSIKLQSDFKNFALQFFFNIGHAHITLNAAGRMCE